jgi:AcrR family transcriptional regulator
MLVAVQTPTRPLPRGRHRLPRHQVVSSQRTRMLRGMAEAMMEKGYVNTTVADVIKRAGVSRETFYQQFSSKADCFMTAFDAAADLLIGVIEAGADLDIEALGAGDGRAQETRLAQFDRGLTLYLDTLAQYPEAARLFLVEVYAAGPEAIRRRAAVQRRIVDVVVKILGFRPDDEPSRFASEVLVAGIGSLVTEPLVSSDPSALRDLREPLVALVRRAVDLTT